MKTVMAILFMLLVGGLIFLVATSAPISNWLLKQVSIEVPVERLIEVDPNQKAIGELIIEESERAGVPEIITRAMATVESGHKLNPFATRFEPSVYSRIKADDDVTRRALASSHGILQVMGYHAAETCKGIVRHWSELYQAQKGLRCGLKILNDCLGKASKIVDASERFTRALGCYNGDGDNYPRLVKLALADLVIDNLGSK